MADMNTGNVSELVAELKTANKNTSLLITTLRDITVAQTGAATALTAIQTSQATLATQTTSIASSQSTIAAQSQRLHTGTFTMTATATRVVTDVNVLTTSQIFLQATNLAAGTLMGSAKALAVTAKSAATSFTVSTANATSAAGTETLSYVIINP